MRRNMAQTQPHPQTTFLYERSGSYIPRIAAVHDLCGYGKCSLTTAIPVLSAAGCDVLPVPTGLFSAHTGFKVFSQFDTTALLHDYIAAWHDEDVTLDAIYSGFLANPEQVDIILRLYETYPSALRIVDPVMGDAGKLYATYTPELCEAMRRLVDGADILLPNITEASILLNVPFSGEQLSLEQVDSYIEGLLGLGAKAVVLKGVRNCDTTLINCVACAAKDQKSAQQHIARIGTEALPFSLHGTGDLFASSVLGAIMCGCSLLDAVQFASMFTKNAMLISTHQPSYKERGVSFEPLLGEMCDLLRAHTRAHFGDSAHVRADAHE